jgi:stage V sporulation protein G
MKITDVRVRILNTNNRLRGIASITIDDAFAVHELRIIEGREGLFVAMPSRKVPEGEFRDVAHPINLETREELEKQVLAKYEEELKKENNE